MKISSIGFLIVFCSIALAAMGSETVTLTPTDDAFIQQNDPDVAFGSEEALYIRTFDGFLGDDDNSWQTLIRFDLSGIPDEAEITSANLLLYFVGGEFDPAGRELKCFQATSDWEERTVTWTTRPSTGIVTTDTIEAPALAGWMNWDVTADVSVMVSGAESNFGWVLLDNAQSGLLAIPVSDFHSKEYGLLSPYLEVIYEYTPPVENDIHLVCGPGAGENNPARVRLFDPADPSTIFSEWTAYSGYTSGVNVACGDLDGDEIAEIVTGLGPGWGIKPHVRAYDSSGAQLSGINFLAYGTRRYGVTVACGDVDGDGYDEVVTGAGPGRVYGSHVRAWDCDGGTPVSVRPVNFLAYTPYRWGVNVSCGDIDGDGISEIVTAPGPGSYEGFAAHIRGWNYDGGNTTSIDGVNFLAFSASRYGANVACGDLDGDGIDEIITGSGPGPQIGAHVRGWSYNTAGGSSLDGTSDTSRYGGNEMIRLPGDTRIAGSVSALEGVDFIPYSEAEYGAVVAAADVDGDGIDEILTMPGPDRGQPARVKAWDVDGGTAAEISSIDFDAFEDQGLYHGGKIAGGCVTTSEGLITQPGLLPEAGSK